MARSTFLILILKSLWIPSSQMGSGSEWEDGDDEWTEDLCPPDWSFDETSQMCFLYVGQRMTWSAGQDYCKTITDK